MDNTTSERGSRPTGFRFTAHAQALCAAVSALNESEPIGLFALIDRAQITPSDSCRRWLNPSDACQDLFEGCFAPSALALSPRLIQLPANVTDAAAAIRALSECAGEVPALSFVASPLKLRSLADHLRALMVLETDEGPAYLFRLADTHALVAMIKALTDTQRAALFTGIARWWVVDQLGQLFELAGHLGSTALPCRMPLSLSSEQLDAALSACVLPITAAQLRLTDAGFAQQRLADQIDYVARQVHRAQSAGFSGDAELLLWCQTALQAGETFDEHPTVRLLLQRARGQESSDRLAEALAFVDESIWAALRGNAGRAQADHG